MWPFEEEPKFCSLALWCPNRCHHLIPYTFFLLDHFSGWSGQKRESVWQIYVQLPVQLEQWYVLSFGIGLGSDCWLRSARCWKWGICPQKQLLEQLLEFLITRPRLGLCEERGSPHWVEGLCLLETMKQWVQASATDSGCEGTLCLPLMWLAAYSLGLGVSVVQHPSVSASDLGGRAHLGKQGSSSVCENVYAIHSEKLTARPIERFCFLMKMFCRNIVILNINMSTWCSEKSGRTAFLRHVCSAIYNWEVMAFESHI